MIMPSRPGEDRLSRRSLLRFATACLSLAGVGALAACGGAAGSVATLASSTHVPASTATTASSRALTTERSSLSTTAGSSTIAASTSSTVAASSGTTVAVSAASQAPSGAPVHLRFAMYSFQAWTDRLKIMFADYAKAHPSVQPELDIIASDIWTKIQTQALAGTPPDLSIVDPAVFVEYANRNFLLALTSYVGQDKLDLSQWYPQTIDDGRHAKGSLGFGEGTLYAMPVTNVGMVVYYNKTLFANDGVPEPTNDWTWQQFLEAAQKLTHRQQPTPQFGVVGALGPKNMDGFLFSAGGDYMNAAGTEGALSSAPAQTALGWLADLEQKYHVLPTDAEIKGIKDGFQNGRWAMEVNGTWNVDTYVKQIKSYQWDIAPVPVGPAGVGGRRTYVDANVLSIYSGSAHHQETWDLLKYLVSEEPMKLWAQTGTPCLIKVAQSPAFLPPGGKPDHRQVMVDLPNYEKNLYREPGSNYWVGDVGKALTPLWQGKTDAKTAAGQADDAIRIGLDKAKSEAKAT